MSHYRSRTTSTPPSVKPADPTTSESPINGSCALVSLIDQLRPSIAGIVGFSELLEFTDLDGDQAEFVAAISTASRQLDRLLSVIGSQQATPTTGGECATSSTVSSQLVDDEFVIPAVCTVRQLIDQAVGAVADHATERQIEIVADTTGDDHPILVDDKGLTIVLTNLVSNAVAHSNGRRVRVAAVRVRGDSEFETYRFAVSDDGGSLDPSGSSQIFSNTPGLAANQEWVVRRGGQIEVAVDPGMSTTFWFDIPVAVAYAESVA